MPQVKKGRPSREELDELGVKNWNPWECEPSTFDWYYDTPETAYILEGEVTVKTPEGEVEIGPGDLVTFPEGLKCTWHVKKKIRKVYKFG